MVLLTGIIRKKFIFLIIISIFFLYPYSIILNALGLDQTEKKSPKNQISFHIMTYVEDQ